MALWICTGCTCRYAVGAARCPQCQSSEYVEEGAAEMAKISVHGGATNAATAAQAEVGEDVSAGTSSSTSAEKQTSAPEPSEKPTPSRARTTASRSKKARTEASSAVGTDGDPAAGTSATAED